MNAAVYPPSSSTLSHLSEARLSLSIFDDVSQARSVSNGGGP